MKMMRKKKGKNKRKLSCSKNLIYVHTQRDEGSGEVEETEGGGTIQCQTSGLLEYL